jgi:hypothetical protein
MCEWEDNVDVICDVQWANFDEVKEIGGKEVSDGMSAVSHEALQQTGFRQLRKRGC